MKMRSELVLALGLAFLGAGACAGDDGETLVDGFTAAELAKIKTLSPLPALEPDTTNKLADDPKAAELGHSLFFEKSYSGPIVTGDDGTNGGNGKVGEMGKIACVSCHQTDKTWIDRRSTPNNTSLGANWVIRNASSVLNASYYTWLENDGLRDSQWSDALTDPEDPGSMNGSRLRVAHMMYAKYKDRYNAIFAVPLDPALDPAAPDAARFPPDGKPKGSATAPDGPWEKMAPADQKAVSTIYANFGKAMQAYLRLLVSQNSPFDRYVAGDASAIGESQKRGLKLFIGKANCVGCHDGPLLSDQKFHTTGVSPLGDHIDPAETGRFGGIGSLLACEFNSNSEFSDDLKTKRLDGVVAADAEKGKWRTKGLREIAETAPYMHTGQIANLKEVLKFYNKGGDESGFVGVKDKLMKPLNLSDAELDDLAAFLGTLTGDPVSAKLAADTAAP